jgi:hypothetical protein
MSSVALEDPFKPNDKFLQQGQVAAGADYVATYHYVNYGEGGWANAFTGGFNPRAAIVNSMGPDREHDGIEHYGYLINDPTRAFNINDVNGVTRQFPAPAYIHMVYDPTNGTISHGDIGYGVGQLSDTGFLGED